VDAAKQLAEMIPHTAMREMFNRNAIGVRGSRSTISPTPMA
jgi:hypothetical protein